MSRSPTRCPARDDSPVMTRSRKDVSLCTLAAVSSVGAAVEFTWASGESCVVPFLLQFWPASATSFVFLANPLVSFWVQPLIGRASDRCTSSLGRRRPYILGLTAVGVVGLAMLFVARPVGLLLGGAAAVPWVAFVGYSLADAAHDCLLTPSRALVEDVAPARQQQGAMAVFTTVSMLGKLGALLLGSLPAAHVLGQDAQLRTLMLASAAMLLCAAAASVCAVRERPLLSPREAGADPLGELIDGVARKARGDLESPLLASTPQEHKSPLAHDVGVEELEMREARASLSARANSFDDLVGELLADELRASPLRAADAPTRTDASTPLDEPRPEGARARSAAQLRCLAFIGLTQVVCWVGPMVFCFYCTAWLSIDATLGTTPLHVAFVALAAQAAVAVVTAAATPRLNACLGIKRVWFFGGLCFALALAAAGWWGPRSQVDGGVIVGGEPTMAEQLVTILCAAVSGGGYAVVANNCFLLVEALDVDSADARRGLNLALVNNAMPLAQILVGGGAGFAIGGLGGDSRAIGHLFIIVGLASAGLLLLLLAADCVFRIIAVR